MLNKEKTMNFTGKLLGIWAFAVAVCHTLMAAFCYVIPYWNYTRALRWVGLGLLVATVLYSVVSLFVSKESRAKAKQAFRRVWSFELAMLIGVLFWFVLSCAVNQVHGYQKYLKTNDWLLFDSTVCFFLLFPMAGFLGKEKAKQIIHLLIHVVVIFYTVFTAFCLWRIFHLEVVDLPSGEQAGITRDVQLMLGLHYNSTGMIATTMLCLCIWMVFMEKEIAIRILYTGMGLVQLVVVYLSNSRTVFVGMFAFVLTASFFVPWRLFEKKNLPLRLGGSMLICAVCTILFWSGRSWMFILFERITHLSEELAKEGLAAAVGDYKPVGLSATKAGYNTALLATTGAENARKLTNLSNRTEVWKATLRMMTSSKRIFFFGVTPSVVTDAIEIIGEYHVERVAHAHNILLQIGVSMGVPAMLLFTAFLVSIAIRCVRILIGKRGRKLKYACLIPATVLCFVVIDMAETYLMTRFSIMACCFFLFCGWAVAIDRGQETENKRGEKGEILNEKMATACSCGNSQDT